mmetsp:Transcript_173173/g.421225  ORF Transcript_173173/g.421225 Transcript_173173/m.421225 type:complete len:374 (-) Transcript_173173:240-1361(-)
MVYHALSFCDQIEIAREQLRILDQGVVRPSHWQVGRAMLLHLLLSSLHAHCHARDQDVTVRHEDLRILHNEPRTSRPELVHPLRFREVEGALHADDGLLVLAHGQLLQVIVRLEHDLPYARTHEPSRLEALRLHPPLRVLDQVHGVQGEEGLAALAPAHAQRQGEVLEIHGGGRLVALRHAERARLSFQRQAAEAVLRGELAAELPRRGHVARHALRLPADVVGVAVRPLLLGRRLPPGVVALLRALQEPRRHALAVHGGLLLLVVVDALAQREAARLAETHKLLVRVHRHVRARGHGVPGLGRARLLQAADLAVRLAVLAHDHGGAARAAAEVARAQHAAAGGEDRLPGSARRMGTCGHVVNARLLSGDPTA